MQGREASIRLWSGWAWVLAALWLVGLLIALRLIRDSELRRHGIAGTVIALAFLMVGIVGTLQFWAAI